MLGSAEQAKAAFFYCVKYVNKNGVGLASAASAMLAALNAVKFAEQREKQLEADHAVVQAAREDGIFEERVKLDLVKKVCNMLINNIQGGIEVSSQQAASAVLGFTPIVSTHRFWQLYPRAAEQYVMQQFAKMTDDIKPSTDSSSSSSFSGSTRRLDKQPRQDNFLPSGPIDFYPLDEIIQREGGDEVNNELDIGLRIDEIEKDEDAYNDANEAFSSASAYDRHCLHQASVYAKMQSLGIVDGDDEGDDDNKINEFGFGQVAHDSKGKFTGIVTQVISYAFRPKELANLSLYDFTAGFKIIPKKKTKEVEEEKKEDIIDDQVMEEEEKEAGARDCNPVYEFQQGHPQFETHVIQTSSKLFIPELVGPPPKCPTEYNERTQSECDTFARYILTILKPFDINTKTPTATEEEFSWNGLCSYLVHLGAEGGLWENLGVLQIIDNIHVGIKSSANERKITNDYRRRGTKPWIQIHADEYDEELNATVRGEKDFFNNGDSDDEDDPDQACALLAALNAYNATHAPIIQNLAKMYVN